MKSTLNNKTKTFLSLDGEIWVPIFRDYEISNMGRVVSNKGRSPRILKTFLTWRKYHIVHLRINNKRKAFTIHRLVALIFIPNLDPNKCEVNHHFGKDDNRAQSLSWMSPEENNKHAIANKLFNHGSAHYKTTLDPLQVIVIRSMQGKLKQREVASYFNISRGSVDSIYRRKSWGHVA